MKAVAVFPSQRNAKLIECDEPQLSATGGSHPVKLRMREVGICGTDREILSFQYGAPPPGSDYLILGHESLGQVAEVGAGVTRVRPGDLAVLTVRRPCTDPECIACRSGRPDFCFTGGFRERGIKELHGYMAEYVVEEEKYVAAVPSELGDIAVLVEPLTIAEKGFAQFQNIQQRFPWKSEGAERAGTGGTALVLGAGPVGLLGAMKLVINGFQTFIYSRGPETRPEADFLRNIGGTYISSDKISPQQVQSQLGRVDVVYEATGASEFAFRVLEILGANGVFIFTGVPGRKAPVAVDTSAIMRNMVLKNQLVFGTVNAPLDAFENAIQDLGIAQKRWPKAMRSLITARYPADDFAGALSAERSGIKTVIRFV